MTAKQALVAGFVIAAQALFSIAALAQAAHVSDGPLSKTCRLCGTEQWEIEVAVPLWLPSVSGSFGSGQLDSPDSAFGENLAIDSSIRFAMMGRLNVRLGAWGLGLDGFGAQLTNSIKFNSSDTELGSVDLAGGFMRMAASYRAPAIEFGKAKRPLLLRFSPYAGTRFYRLNVDLARDDDSDEQDRKWWDPIVGLGAALDFRVGLVLRAQTDVGGFGWGSEIAWWFASSLEYEILDWLAVSAGWSFVRFEQNAGSGAHNLDLELSMNGPTIALSFYVQ